MIKNTEGNFKKSEENKMSNYTITLEKSKYSKSQEHLREQEELALQRYIGFTCQIKELAFRLGK